MRGENDMADEPMKAEIILYQSEGVNVPVPVRFQSDTFWLTQQQIADLFLKDKSTISRHLKNIFDDGELQEESVVAVFATTASDGKVYQVSYYNLDVAEDRAERHVLLSMDDCDKLLDDFLQFNGRGVLPDKGSRNRRQAEAKAKAEFAEFQKVQDATYENDFEKMAKRKLIPGVF